MESASKDDNDNDDIEIEPDKERDDSVVAEETAAETIKKLRGKLKDAEQKAAEYLAGWQRSQADFINYKKREALDRQEFLKFSALPVISDAIIVLDDFDSAFANKTEWQKVDKTWRDGVERIHSRLKGVLEKHGVTVVDPIGEIFDPGKHLAVSMVPVKTAEEDGKVISVIHKGYALNGKIIRPANVTVGQHQAN